MALPSYREAVDAATAELARFSATVRQVDASSWSRPTRLDGWDVAGLVRHVTAAAWQQAEAYHRARLAIPEPPAFVTANADATELASVLDVARDHLDNAILRLDATPDPIVPLPFASLPASLAACVLLIEYGTHMNDLEHALGAERPMREIVATTVVELMSGMLPLIAAPVTDEPPSYRLAAPAKTTTARYSGDAWSTADDDAVVDATIEGSNSAIALFSLGRIGTEDRGLTVNGDVDAATRFKQYFPGP